MDPNIPTARKQRPRQTARKPAAPKPAAPKPAARKVVPRRKPAQKAMSGAAVTAPRVPSFAQQRAQQEAATAQSAAPPAPLPPMPPARPAPAFASGVQQRRSVSRHHAAGSRRKWGLIALVGGLVAALSVCAALTLGVLLLYGGGILPGVRVLDVPLGGKSVEEAINALNRNWGSLTVTDGERTWQLDPAALGLQLDTYATAQRAYDQGRGLGSPFSAVLGVNVAPVLIFDTNAARIGLYDFAPTVQTPAVNAGVRFVNGQVEATPAQDGRALDVEATVAQIAADPETMLADGVLHLVIGRVAPAVTDSSGMVAAAAQILASPLQIRLYDPIRDEWGGWNLPPEQWAGWLTAAPDTNSTTGLALAVDPVLVRAFLEQQAGAFGVGRYINVDEGVAAVQQAIAANRTDPWVRVYEHERQHTVQPGETIISIAWDYGVPYPWVQAANGGIESLSVGQSITIPSADNFLQLPIVPEKRIIVSISEQRTRVFENGELKWDWVSSTGINSSPTWTGIYQIISHEPNAYAGNWNLWMPNFMGVYRPIPGADFTNGFHGFPTRGGSQLLWTNSLGTRVTYGCILLSNENAQTLYNWAEAGVVVEIRP